MADEDLGQVEAVVARYSVVDADGDVIMPGAVREGHAVIVSDYGHASMLDARLPVGVGTLHTRGDELVVRAQYFMDVPRAVDAFRTLKRLGAVAQWSFGFRTLQWRPPDEQWRLRGAERLLLAIDPAEVSPVVRGAGIGTRTVAAKRADAEHEAAVLAEVLRYQETVARAERLARRRATADPVRQELRRFLDASRRGLAALR